MNFWYPSDSRTHQDKITPNDNNKRSTLALTVKYFLYFPLMSLYGMYHLASMLSAGLINVSII